MLAITHDRYGAVDSLEHREVPAPELGARDVLVRVHAASLHPGDVFTVTGSPFPVRIDTGLFRPKRGTPGFDIAGTVVATGPAATRWRVGDEVFGTGRGAAAELAATAEDQLVAKPASLSFETAAAIPTSGLAALHALRDAGRVRAGQRVLVNGASGGIGSFAVQIAKALGAHVTGVASTANVELVRSLGADRVIDYTREDFTSTGPYDVILDNVENRRLGDVRRALAPRGTLILNSGTGASGVRFFARLVAPILLSPFVGQNLKRYLSTPNATDLAELRDLAESGRLRSVVERTWSLEETPAALRHIASGHARGKVVIAMGS